MAEHAAWMRRLAALVVVGGTLLAIGAPLVSVYLGLCVPIGIAAWLIGVPMWRRAGEQGDGRPRVVTFRDRGVREVVDGDEESAVTRPIVGVRAFAEHVEVIAGTIQPKVSLRQIEIPVAPEERADLIQRLHAEQGLAIKEMGSYARHLGWAFTVVPAGLFFLLTSSRVLLLVLAYGVIGALARLEPATLVLVLVALAFVPVALLTLRWTRR